MSAFQELVFQPARLPEKAEELRQKTRAFLKKELADYSPVQRSNTWSEGNEAFSAKLGKAGLIGLALPKDYGGGGYTNLERYAVMEELLFAGAPVGYHWIADRQSAPLLLRYGSKAQKEEIIPKICKGKVGFCIGMSEPGSGSDLASVQSKATKTSDGWRLNGSKIWTSGAQRAHYMIGLFRSGDDPNGRHQGLTQFLIDMKNTSGIEIRPIKDLAGYEHFNEVFFDDALIPEEALIGGEGQGWAQVTAELSLERSGPERFLSTMVLFQAFADAHQHSQNEEISKTIGSLMGDLITLRAMSISVSAMLAEGRDVSVQAAIVKDLGAAFEQNLLIALEALMDIVPDRSDKASELQQVLANLMMIAPSFTLRGGTIEILRGIIARGIGAR